MQVFKCKSVKFLALNLLFLSIPFSIFAMIFLPQLFSYRPIYVYKCIKVIDGDTVIVSRSGRKYRVRLAFVDAPESSQTSFDDIPIGLKSTEFLKSLILNKKIKVEFLSTDLYGRKIGRIYKGTLSINQIMVENGHALFYDKKTKEEYILAEYRAKVKRLGVWRTDGFLLPSYYRKRKKEARNLYGPK